MQLARAAIVIGILVAGPAFADRTLPATGGPSALTIDTLLPRIANRLLAERDRFPQLRDFPGQRSIVFFNPLHSAVLRYLHGVEEVANPDYERRRREAEEEDRLHGPRLRAAIPKTLPRFDREQGIDLAIELFPDGGATMQRVLAPIGEVGGIPIELRLTTPDPELAQRVTAIVRAEILRSGGKLAR